MAVDKLVDSAQLDADLTSVANAIRTKGGTSASLAFPAGFVSAVEAIPSGGGGGGFDLLYTLDVTENVHAIQVDFSQSWEDYDLILVDCIAKVTSSDWVYFGFNTTSPTIYIASAIYEPIPIVGKKDNTWKFVYPKVGNSLQIFNGFPNYLYLKCYADSKNFTTGTSINIYGGSLS